MIQDFKIKKWLASAILQEGGHPTLRSNMCQAVWEKLNVLSATLSGTELIWIIRKIVYISMPYDYQLSNLRNIQGRMRIKDIVCVLIKAIWISIILFACQWRMYEY